MLDAIKTSSNNSCDTASTTTTTTHTSRFVPICCEYITAERKKHDSCSIIIVPTFLLSHREALQSTRRVVI